MKISKLIVTSLVAVAVWSCSGNVEKETEAVDPRVDMSMSRTAKDTLDLTVLVDRYLTCVKYGDYDTAIAMISDYNETTKKFEAASDSVKNRLMAQYMSFPIVSYTIDDMKLYSETDTEVRYTVTMFERKEGDNMPNTMRFMLSPKRVDGEWRLCVGCRSIMR